MHLTLFASPNSWSLICSHTFSLTYTHTARAYGHTPGPGCTRAHTEAHRDLLSTTGFGGAAVVCADTHRSHSSAQPSHAAALTASCSKKLRFRSIRSSEPEEPRISARPPSSASLLLLLLLLVWFQAALERSITLPPPSLSAVSFPRLKTMHESSVSPPPPLLRPRHLSVCACFSRRGLREAAPSLLSSLHLVFLSFFPLSHSWFAPSTCLGLSL